MPNGERVEFKELYCDRHGKSYELKIIHRKLSYFDPDAGPPTYTSVNEGIELAGNGCPTCSIERELTELVNKKIRLERLTPSDYIKVLGRGLLWGIIFSILGFFRGCIFVPSKIVDSPDPSLYFGYLWSQTGKGFIIGILAGILLKFFFFLREHHYIQKRIHETKEYLEKESIRA